MPIGEFYRLGAVEMPLVLKEHGIPYHMVYRVIFSFPPTILLHAKPLGISSIVFMIAKGGFRSTIQVLRRYTCAYNWQFTGCGGCLIKATLVLKVQSFSFCIRLRLRYSTLFGVGVMQWKFCIWFAHFKWPWSQRIPSPHYNAVCWKSPVFGRDSREIRWALGLIVLSWREQALLQKPSVLTAHYRTCLGPVDGICYW